VIGSERPGPVAPRFHPRRSASHSTSRTTRENPTMPTYRSPLLSALLGVPLLLLLLAACDSLLGDDTPPPQEVLVRLADEENGKTFRVGYPVKVFAFVSDRGGLGVGGVEIRWVAPDGSGTIQSAQSRTNGNGFAEAVWVPGTHAGMQEIRVELVS